MSINPNPTNESTVVSYKLNNTSSAYIMITDFYGNNGIQHNYIIDVNSSQINLNTSTLNSGFFNLSLICDGQITDVKTLIK